MGNVDKNEVKFEKSFFVVPGIRPQGSHHGDQTRVATPEVALKAGASALVIGRPLLEAKDPVALLKNISHSL